MLRLDLVTPVHLANAEFNAQEQHIAEVTETYRKSMEIRVGVVWHRIFLSDRTTTPVVSCNTLAKLSRLSLIWSHLFHLLVKCCQVCWGVCQVYLRSHFAATFVPQRRSVVVFGGSRYFTGKKPQTKIRWLKM